MAKRIAVDRFGRKVHLFNAAFEIGTQKDLAALLGAKPNTLGLWISDDRVPEAALEQLAQMLVDRHPTKLASVEAYAAWCGPYSAFEAIIFQRPLVELLSVLRSTKSELKVSRISVGTGFAMVADSLDLGEQVEAIPQRDQYRFEIDGRVGSSLTVLCADEKGWRLLAPGRLHDGIIANQPELFPRATTPPLRFRDLGLHHFLFIELPKALSPLLPTTAGVAPINDVHLDQFARQLTQKAWAGAWRWKEAIYEVYD